MILRRENAKITIFQCSFEAGRTGLVLGGSNKLLWKVLFTTVKKLGKI